MSWTKLSVYLVGVDHRIQYTNADCGPEWTVDIREFEDYLVNHATQLDVDLMAEEFNEYLVQKNSATGCTVRDAAQRVGCPHLFCDPDVNERSAKAITSSEQREAVWLDHVKASEAQRVLFVCGNDHLETFAEKLRANGFKVDILSRGWGNDWRFKN